VVQGRSNKKRAQTNGRGAAPTAAVASCIIAFGAFAIGCESGHGNTKGYLAPEVVRARITRATGIKAKLAKADLTTLASDIDSCRAGHGGRYWDASSRPPFDCTQKDVIVHASPEFATVRITSPGLARQYDGRPSVNLGGYRAGVLGDGYEVAGAISELGYVEYFVLTKQGGSTKRTCGSIFDGKQSALVASPLTWIESITCKHGSW
jgi:hypothetical protein